MAISRAFEAVVTAIALAVAGGVCVAASQAGFFGTCLVSVFSIIWLTAIRYQTLARSSESYTYLKVDDDVEEENVMLRVLLDQAPGALLMVHGQRVRALNRAARTLFSTNDDVQSAPVELFVPGTTRLRFSGRSWRIDRVNIVGPGLPYDVIALVDIEAIEYAAEARAARELLRVLGHEVMNSLSPIASLAESGLQVLAAPERHNELLEEILNTLARRADGLRRFTEAYRQIGRLPEPTLTNVPISELLSDIRQLFDVEWKGRVTLEIDESVDVHAMLDRDQMAQALLALLRNGAEAAISAGKEPTVRISTRECDERIIFKVSDNGKGIDASLAATIFSPFFTTKLEGNGIGLTSARYIANGHGGDVILSTGLPTTFEITIPR